MSKKLEIQQKARKYNEELFPRTLHTIDSDYDYNRKMKMSNPKDVFKRVRLDILFENYSMEQKKYLFDLLDKVYNFFMEKKWYEFNYLTNLILDEKNTIPIPDEISFMRNKEFLSITEKMIEDKRDLISDEYLSLKEDMIDSLFADVEPKGEIEEEAYENELYAFLDDIRNRDYTYLELYDTVKKKTGLDSVALEYFKKDVELYLFTTKETHEVFFSQEDVDRAFKDLEDKGYTKEDLITRGYLKKSLLLTESNKKEDAKETYYVDKEKLLFPFEFYPIYELLRIINKELNKHQESESNTELSENLIQLKTNLSVPQLALLFTLLNNLKPNLFELKSEAELHRFISANFKTKKSSESGISTNKLRNLFNSPDPKSAEFWEKHFYTLVAEIKKFK